MQYVLKLELESEGRKFIPIYYLSYIINSFDKNNNCVLIDICRHETIHSTVKTPQI